mmetsp:Transcript_15739/g.23166  ORF Transcript_15739/g.23166 Transcript_15739/m.23166 type:complete len:288 (-) Transcript_15739:126-989(-)|eukprot:CAMPEP_0194249620 /NCGR_PEP_ID=MMETSP0158-20130606/20897_1 /TAXON_ID=33649 /ORGANISM="Thalassionema nitzschioides, Strain L26-B" /LENGTH=287 /DNA_ID=CAMNT_0038986175 /DNA_START=50 /DNA_END=913 /DNA_ORIENTATION=-
MNHAELMNESFSLQVDNDKKMLVDSKEPIPIHQIKADSDKRYFVQSSLHTHKGSSSDKEYDAIINILRGQIKTSKEPNTSIESENNSNRPASNQRRGDSLSFLYDILEANEECKEKESTDETLFPAGCNQYDFLDCSDEEDYEVTVKDIYGDAFEITPQHEDAKISTTNVNLREYENSTDANLVVKYIAGDVIIKDMEGHATPSIKSRRVSIKPGEQFAFFGSAMRESYKSQLQIHDWDRKMGLKRSHSKTMRHSMKTRNALRKLLSAAVKGRADIGTPLPYFPPQA